MDILQQLEIDALLSAIEESVQQAIYAVND